MSANSSSNENRTSKVGREVIEALDELISRISQDKKEFMEAGYNLKGHNRTLLLINEFKDELQKQ